MKAFQVVLLLLLSTAAQGFVILPQEPACRCGPSSVARLVPEQAKDLEAFYECECELKVQRKQEGQDSTVSALAQSRQRPIMAWCRRVWNGVGRNEELRFRRQTSSTLAHKEDSTSTP